MVTPEQGGSGVQRHPRQGRLQQMQMGIGGTDIVVAREGRMLVFEVDAPALAFAAQSQIPIEVDFGNDALHPGPARRRTQLKTLFDGEFEEPCQPLVPLQIANDVPFPGRQLA